MFDIISRKGDQWYDAWKPKESYYAIKYKGEFHPCTYHKSTLKAIERGESAEAFIYGHGWKKSKRYYEIPLFDYENGDYSEYIESWGSGCLYYSLTGKNVNDWDCCYIRSRQIFKVCLQVGFEIIGQAELELKDLNDQIQKIIYTKYGSHENYEFVKRDLFDLRYSYSLMGLMITRPHLDVVADDKRLEHHWNRLTSWELGSGDFPVSMKERLTFLFSEKVSKSYEILLNKYPIAVN